MDQGREPKSYEMGVQVPGGVYPKGQEKPAVWAIAQAPWGGISDTGAAKGVSCVFR